MKTRFTLLALLLFSLSSCLKDFYGDGYDKVELTADNYLYDGVLENIFLNEEISAIDATIDKLNKVAIDDPGYNDAQAEIKALSEKRVGFKERMALIVDLSSVGQDWPIPCDGFPNGKCVPVRLEYFVFSKRFKEAFVLVEADNGKQIGASSELKDLPGFEGDLAYIRIPVTDFDKEIKVSIARMDIDGIKSDYKIVLSN